VSSPGVRDHIPAETGRDAAIPPPVRRWLAELAEYKNRARAKGFRLTVTNVRESLDTLTRLFVTRAPKIALVRDDVIPAPQYPVPVRIYHPVPDRPLPVALFVHGGGHVAGGITLYDSIARKLASVSQWVIVSVEYRLAPECPYPAGLKDVLASAKRVFRLLDNLQLAHTPRLGLIGDSAGGALCATAAHLGQYEPGLEIERQVLIYPSLDYSLSSPSVLENGTGYFLERDRILWMFDSYLQNQEHRRQVSPLFMEFTAKYPQTLLITSEFDPLRDEGARYGRSLQEAGHAVEHLHFAEMIHAFLNIEDLVPEVCSRAYNSIGAFLNR